VFRSTSTRSLYRRLAESGVAFQSLLDEVRCSMAQEFLSLTPLPIEEIAHRTGFSDAASFRKAFKRWTGQPPSAWRIATHR
jgi:AraC-like DNA-binding protein